MDLLLTLILSIIPIGVGIQLYFIRRERIKSKKYILSLARDALNSRAGAYDPDLVKFCHRLLNDVEEYHKMGMSSFDLTNTFKEYTIKIEWHWITSQLTMDLTQPERVNLVTVTYAGG